MVSGRLFGLNEKILKVNWGCLGLSEIVRYILLKCQNKLL